MRTFFVVLVSCLFIFGCGGKGNKNPLSLGHDSPITPLGPGDSDTPSNDPPDNPVVDDPIDDPVEPDPDPSPVVIDWTFPDQFIGRNVVYEPTNDAIYVSGIKTNGERFFTLKFNPETGREGQWYRLSGVDDVTSNWVTKGLTTLGGDVYAIRWEDPMGLGSARIYTNRYDQTGDSPSPWPIRVGDHTMGMDLAAGDGLVFAATPQNLIALTTEGDVRWQSSFGFGAGRQNIMGLAFSTDGRLFMSGYTKGSIWEREYMGGLADIFVGEINPGTSELIDGFTWGDETFQVGYDLVVLQDGIVVAVETGFTFEGGQHESKLIKFSFDGDVIWIYSTDHEKRIYGITIDSEENIYILSNALRRVSPSGSLVWTVDIRAHDAGGVAYDTNRNVLYVVNDSEDGLFRIAAGSGSILQ